MDDLEAKIGEIAANLGLSYDQKIMQLTDLYKKSQAKGDSVAESLVNRLENAIEDAFGEELRRLNAIRERCLEGGSMDDIKEMKKGFGRLFELIDLTFGWNATRHQSMYGVINRGSLRAMMVDPEVSVVQKREIMDHWEDYM